MDTRIFSGSFYPLIRSLSADSLPPYTHLMVEGSKTKEPIILWWMPVVALLGPVVWAAWEGASAESGGLEAALTAFVWPGALVYLAALAVLWGGWKIDLE